ncbi:MAG: hypothetical protein L6Q38_02145 [Nitrospira sp.]|nr:hypothetical protein [Nitrospira sp.]
MSVLLLIRNADVLDCAVEAATAFLIHQRSRVAERHPADEVLGIWLRSELDGGLPTWPRFDLELRLGVAAESVAGETASGPDPNETAVGIRESFSLSGVWTLCWIDGIPLRQARTPVLRRRTILEVFLTKVADSEFSCEPRSFLPVFQATEKNNSVQATLRDLRNLYPRLIGDIWFVDDREHGIRRGRGGGK